MSYIHVFCICTCAVQLSMFHMKRRSRNMLIITIIILLVIFSRYLELVYPKRLILQVHVNSILFLSVLSNNNSSSSSSNSNKKKQQQSLASTILYHFHGVRFCLKKKTTLFLPCFSPLELRDPLLLSLSLLSFFFLIDPSQHAS